MVSKILLSISIAGLIVSSGLGWLLKNQYEENGILEARNTELSRHIDDLALANSNLNKQIDSLLAEKEWLVDQIRQGEDQKRKIRSQLEVSNDELQKALSESPDFNSYPLPDPVSDVVGRQLERLWPDSTNGSENRNASSETDSP